MLRQEETEEKEKQSLLQMGEVWGISLQRENTINYLRPSSNFLNTWKTVIIILYYCGWFTTSQTTACETTAVALTISSLLCHSTQSIKLSVQTPVSSCRNVKDVVTVTSLQLCCSLNWKFKKRWETQNRTRGVGTTKYIYSSNFEQSACCYFPDS